MTEQNRSFPFYFASWYKKSPYFAKTVEAGATSWDLYNHMLIPTLYDDDVKEYWHLVEKVTLWDVAVERQLEITGPDAARFTQLLTPRDLSQTRPEQCKYVLICAPDGGIINDPILLKLAEDHFWLSLADSDALLYALGVQAFAGMDVEIGRARREPAPDPGPALEAADPQALRRRRRRPEVLLAQADGTRRHPGGGLAHGMERRARATRCTCVTRTRAHDLWDAILAAGEEFELRAIAPSDQRRMEAGIFNYGNDMDITNNPYEVTGLERLVELDNDNQFVSREALERSGHDGVSRKLVGVDDRRRTPRACGSRTSGPSWTHGVEVGRLVERLLLAAPRVQHGVRLGADRRGRRGLTDRDRLAGGPMTATVTALPFLDPKKEIPAAG